MTLIALINNDGILRNKKREMNRVAKPHSCATRVLEITGVLPSVGI
jgi:hypothetical protein